MDIIVLAFDDDMVFLLGSQIQVTKTLKSSHKYFEINGMCVNINKTNIVVFEKGGGNHLKKFDPFMNNGQKIELKNKYTYLGITLSQSGTFKAAAKELSNKAKRAIPETIAMLDKIKVVNWQTCNKLYESLV